MRATINGLRIATVALFSYWVLLFIGTHMPANKLIAFMHLASMHQSDKVLHLGAFAGLAFLMAWAIPTNMQKLYQNTRLAALVTVAYAGLDELLQIPVGRTADWNDFYADCFGMGIGLLVYSIIRALILRAQWNLFQDPAQTK